MPGAAKAPVCDVDSLGLRVQEKVLEFDVTMHEAGLVRVLDATANLRKQAARGRLRQTALLAQPHEHVAAFDEGHGEDAVVLGLEEVECGEVRFVRHRAHDLGLVACVVSVVLGSVLVGYLECSLLAGDGVLCEPHHAEGTLA